MARTSQHGLVDSCDLVRQGIDARGMYRQHRIEQMGQEDAVCFGYQTDQRAIAVEAP